jgi:hypothetical protein
MVVKTEATESKSEAALMNPYNEVDMKPVLERKYLVESFSWVPGDAFGTNLGMVRFPEALYNIPNIADKLAQFRWLRSDVTVEVRINTTPLHIGALVVSWLPHHDGTIAGSTGHLAQRIQNNAEILSASSLNAVTFDIIRGGPRLADPVHSNPSGQIGAMWVDVLNPLKFQEVVPLRR